MNDLVQQMIIYAKRHGDLLGQYMMEHIFILVVSFIVSYVVAGLITIVMRKVTIIRGPVNGL